MTLYWETKDGQKIKFSDLENTHLVNIIKFVKKRAKEMDGQVIEGGGTCPEDFWVEIGYTEDWLKKYNYQGLLKEAKKRNIWKS